MSKYLKGDLLTFKVGSSAIAAATSHSISFSASTANVTTKDDYTAGVTWENNEVTSKSWSGTAEGMIYLTDPSSSTTFDSLLSNFVSGEEAVTITLYKGETAVGHGSAYLTGLDISGSTGDQATFSATFTGAGAWTSGAA